MHFFYLDESGDTGKNLDDPEQPVMVLGGVSVRDEAWNATAEMWRSKLNSFFSGQIPEGFELHANELLSPSPQGALAAFSQASRNQLALDILGMLNSRKHNVHFIAIDKAKVKSTKCGLALSYNPSRPYLLAFDYMITLTNWYARNRLGLSARGMIVVDEKRNSYQDHLAVITRNRRFEVAKAHRVKWIAEITYAIDSVSNPMIQFSDLIVYCARRFIELEHEYRNNWPDAAKKFYRDAYAIIDDRVIRKQIISCGQPKLRRLDDYLNAVALMPKRGWRARY